MRGGTFSHVLLIGARGMLGQELSRQLRDLQRRDESIQLTELGPGDIDIRDRDAVLASVRRMNPSTIINAAAYTNVDGCERQVDLAMEVNATGAGNLADASREVGATLVHYSTDFVFDGRATRPYRPADKAGPLSVYGRSKWEGEEAVRQSGAKHLIIRTSWLFGTGGRNFVEAILDRVESGQPLSVVTDQVGRPTLTDDLAEATITLMDVAAEGVFHFANDGECSWNEFAKEIVRLAGYRVEVQPMTSDKLDRPAKRPAYSVLDTSDYERVTGRTISDWRDALGRYLKQRRLEPVVHAAR